MHQGLHICVHLASLGLVGFTSGLYQQLVELFVFPAGFIPGCCRLEELREQHVGIWPRVDVAEAQRVLRPVIGPVAVARQTVDVEFESSFFG
ncbi:hypothetical protein D3C75_502030 [compost metagenome]